MLRDLREWYEEAGLARTNLVVDVDFLKRVTQLAAVTMVLSLESVVNYIGWNAGVLDDFASAVDRVFPSPTSQTEGCHHTRSQHHHTRQNRPVTP